MRTDKQFLKRIAITALLLTGISTAGIAQDLTTIVKPEADMPVILSTSPAGGEANVDLGSAIEITFSSEMDETTINGKTLLLHATYEDTVSEMQVEMRDNQIRDRTPIKESENTVQYTSGTINGTITYSNRVATFTPSSELKEGTLYTFTVTSGAENSQNLALENDHTWSFTTTGSSDPAYSDEQNGTYGTERNPMETIAKYRHGLNRHGLDRSEYSESSMDTMQKDLRNMIDLGQAGQFVILAKTTINNESESRITGRTGEGTMTDDSKTDRTKTDQAKKENAYTDSVKGVPPIGFQYYNRTDPTRPLLKTTQPLRQRMSVKRSKI